MAFDFDLLVIGAGSGGVRASRFAAGFGAKVAVVEERYLGGTCVNVGCVPKKLFHHGAEYAEEFKLASGYGWQLGQPQFDWQTLLVNKDREITRLNGIYGRMLADAGVTLLEGHARILGPHEVEVAGQHHSAERILVATGSWPMVPDIPGKEHIITSNEAFHLASLPRRMTVVGGGYIAVEFASIFQALGVKVSLLYRRELFLRGFDDALREHLRSAMQERGIDLQFNTQVARIEKTAAGLTLHLEGGRTLDTDSVFYATGRVAKLDGLGLENTAVELDERGYIKVDENYQTTEPSILAIGDVIGRVQLTPVALAEGMAVARRLYKPEQYRGPLDYSLIPTAVFSIPNLGTVGLTEEQARAKGHKVRIFQTSFRDLKLALTDCCQRTLVKLVVDADSDRVLGCHMLGHEAGEIIQGLAVALKAGASKQVFDDTLAIHPTAAEEFVTLRTPLAD